jgi:S-adenosylmethionine:tRNA ribosyltransferase-isomerase
VGQALHFENGLEGEITEVLGGGVADVLFRSRGENVVQAILEQGEVPLPPYIRRDPEARDQERYQTVYAAQPGAIAAPTAGLHFTPEVLGSLKNRGIETAAVTLHVGPGTFLPVRATDYTQHQMHPEYFILPAATAARLNQARAAGKHLVAVGTTSVRVLEHCADSQGITPQEASISTPATTFGPWTISSPTSTCPSPPCSSWSRPSPAGTSSWPLTKTPSGSAIGSTAMAIVC